MEAIVVLFFLVLLVPIIFLGLLNFGKRLNKQVIKKREILEAQKEPLLGYENCSPQFQAYMRKEIKAGRKKPKTSPQGNFGGPTYTEDKNKTYKGKRGGRYTKDKTKDGRPYRRYF